MQQTEVCLRKSCSVERKCSATGDLSNLQCFQSSRWPFILRFNGPFVAPTAFDICSKKWDRQHLLFYSLCHSFSLTAPDEDLTVCVPNIILQVWHLALPQGLDSARGSLSLGSGLSLACTRRSRKLLGLLYAMMGCSGKTLLKSLEDTIMDQCLFTDSLTFGRSGW